jgi:hypothetical protein
MFEESVLQVHDALSIRKQFPKLGKVSKRVRRSAFAVTQHYSPEYWAPQPEGSSPFSQEVTTGSYQLHTFLPHFFKTHQVYDTGIVFLSTASWFTYCSEAHSKSNRLTNYEVEKNVTSGTSSSVSS